MRTLLLLGLFLATATFLDAQEADYTQPIPGTDFAVEMVYLPAGSFTMGSPEDELGRADDEPLTGPITMPAFYISAHEITFDQYLPFREKSYDSAEAAAADYDVDAVTRPSPPYLDFTYGMGSRGGFPAVSMTQQAALRYCRWLYEKTGQFYRLPTEAEWEYACRAGTTTAYYFGDSPTALDDYAWYFDNADDAYHRVGQKQPNAWGLYDMLGNVAEYTADPYTPDRADFDPEQPQRVPGTIRGKYRRVVKGGAYDDDPDACRCAARIPSDPRWQARDPQIPKSIWWNPDSPFVGFRIVRPAGTFTRAQVDAYFDHVIVD